jgi:transposase-like protein
MSVLLTKQRREAICEHLRMGSYLRDAAREVGVNPATVKDWMKKGVSQDPQDWKYRKFRNAVEAAMAESKNRLVGLVSKAAEKDWRAGIALLQARYPKEFSRRPRVVYMPAPETRITRDMAQGELNKLVVEALAHREILKLLPPEDQKLIAEVLPAAATPSEDTDDDDIPDAEFAAE